MTPMLREEGALSLLNQSTKQKYPLRLLLVKSQRLGRKEDGTGGDAVFIGVLIFSCFFFCIKAKEERKRKMFGKGF
jgi:hypothetical protein